MPKIADAKQRREDARKQRIKNSNIDDNGKQKKRPKPKKKPVKPLFIAKKKTVKKPAKKKTKPC